MKFVFISDTHMQHDILSLPEGDVLVHAGDFTDRGSVKEARSFLDWYACQPFQHKVLIAGNHDFLAENYPRAFRSMIPDNVIYLENSVVEIGGLKIWGSPVTPWFFDWAFNLKRGAPIRAHWADIPDDTDVVITHGPPYGVLDEVVRNPRPVGCRDLLQRIEAVQPKLHVFGHIHEGYGQLLRDNTLYVNAAVLDVRYVQRNAPIVLDTSELPDKKAVQS